MVFCTGDKEVVYHYKHWALWHPDHQSWDPGDTVLVFPTDQINNLALKYVLCCSVSDEEWAAVCDQQSSHNLLESLFQDDDDWIMFLTLFYCLWWINIMFYTILVHTCRVFTHPLHVHLFILICSKVNWEEGLYGHPVCTSPCVTDLSLIVYKS